MDDQKGFTRPSVSLALLLEQTARTVYESRSAADMHPGQWAALRYFARANPSARTVTGLANFLGVTPAPASRATRTLVKHGLARQIVNPHDGRSLLIEVTPQALELLANDPILRLARAIDALDASSREQLATALLAVNESMSG